MSNPITERPIILNAQEVNAVLAGNKKQHRVPVLTSEQVATGYKCCYGVASGQVVFTKDESDKSFVDDGYISVKCPLGEVGDRLWVRETHHVPDFLKDYELDELAQGLISRDDLGMTYKADAPHMTPADSGWTSPVGMPRWASRLLLEITDIRIERVQDISEADAIAMGLKPDYCDHKYQTCEDIGCIGKWAGALFLHLRHDKKLAVHYTDWVWVIEFKVIKPSEAGL